ITDGVQQDIEPGGNPYSFIVRNGIFYVSDGNHNRLLKVTTGGDVSAITEFPNHPVSTGVANTASGPFYVGYLGQGPFLPEAGKVVSVAPTTGAITEIASGAAMITDVQVGAGGQLYALQFNDPQEAGEAFFAPGTGKVLRVVGSGFSPLITGLSFATDMVFDGNTLYISNFGIAPVGEVIKVENFSSVTPPAATPTAAPTQAPTQAPPQATATRPGGIVAPSTGTGGTGGAGGDGGTPWLLLAGLAVAGTTLLGSAAALRSKGR
ncbi:MAG TPA: ScyD/ScyE family protein, partial [Methylomirabilota bacterium]|nr:ScyD/ScyE family protein [Methylomirabilota bacterium]